MIIVDKEHHAYLKRELNDRFTKLWDMLHGRPLKDKYEGAGKGSYWPNPESRVAIDAGRNPARCR